MNAWRKNLVSLVLYGLLSIAMTYPLVLDMRHSIYGFCHDNIGTIWNNWVDDISYKLDLDRKHFDFGNYPEGIDATKRLFMYTTDAMNDAMVRMCGDAYLAYNLLMLLKFTFAAFFMYLFLDYILADKKIAFIGGFFFCFSPYIAALSKAYGPSYIPAFMPLLFLALLRMLRQLNLVNVLAFIAVYAVFFGENYYYSYFVSVSIVSTLLLLSLVPWRRDSHPFFWLDLGRFCKRVLRKKIVLASLLLVLLLLGASALALHERLSELIASRSFSMAEAVQRSSRWYFYFIPSVLNSVFGGFIEQFEHKITFGLEAFELTLYLGYVPLFFVTLGVLRYRRMSRLMASSFVLFLALLVVSAVYAMGPYIPLNPINYVHSDTITNYPHIVGPSYITFNLAPMFRFLCRYHIVTIFSLVTCFSISLSYCAKRLPGLKRYVLLVAVAGLVFVEYSDYSQKNVLNLYEHMPKAYKYLASLSGNFPILDVNNFDWPTQAHMMAYQVFHEKKAMGGAYSFFREDITNPAVQDKYRNMGFRYVVIVTKLKPVTYPPMQIHWPDMSKRWEPLDRVGSLKLVKAFDDSLVYMFDDDNEAAS